MTPQLIAQVRGAGGITISISPKLNLEPITKVDINEDTIAVRLTQKEYKINLPPNTLPHIFDMVSENISEPIVFSQDHFFFDANYQLRRNIFQGKSNSFFNTAAFSPFSSVDSSFLHRLFDYDVSVHCLMCTSKKEGWGRTYSYGRFYSTDSVGHSFYPSKAYSPRENVEQYLNINAIEKSKELDYWKIIEKYPVPPSCIGSVHFIAVPSFDSTPFRLVVKTSRFFIIRDWKKDIAVLSKEEEKIADLPYLELAKGIENNWEDYRRRFPTLNQLSNIVEAYVFLEILKQKNQSLFETLKDKSKNTSKYWGDSYISTQTVSPILDEQTWLNYAKSTIGSNIDNTEEAKLELSLLMVERYAKDSMIISEIRRKELEAFARVDSIFQLQLLLFDAITKDAEKHSLYNFFFAKVRLLPDGIQKFKLWAMGIRWLKKEHTFFKLPTSEGKALLNSFNTYLSKKNISELTSEELHELVTFFYESGILKIAKVTFPEKDKNNKYSDSRLVRLISMISEVHYQASRHLEETDLEKRHFHYRFIEHLQNLIPTSNKKKWEEFVK